MNGTNSIQMTGGDGFGDGQLIQLNLLNTCKYFTRTVCSKCMDLSGVSGSVALTLDYMTQSGFTNTAPDYLVLLIQQ